MHKVNPGVWDVMVRKEEAHGLTGIISFKRSQYNPPIITWLDEFIESVPAESVLATRRLADAHTAAKLQTPRTIELSGAITGSASFDGSANITINTTLANRAFGESLEQETVSITKFNELQKELAELKALVAT